MVQRPLQSRYAHRDEIEVLVVLKATSEMRKPRAPRDASQNELLLKNEWKMTRLEHILPDGFQRVKPAVLQMLDEEDGTLRSRSDELVYSKVTSA